MNEWLYALRADAWFNPASGMVIYGEDMPPELVMIPARSIGIRSSLMAYAEAKVKHPEDFTNFVPVNLVT